MLALVVVIVVSFSPTMTAAVVADSGARGRLSDTVLAVVVLADLAMLVLFSVSMLLARVVFDTGAGGGTAILARLVWEIGGAVAFGVLIGVLFALYLRYIGREIVLVLLAVCVLLSQVGTTQQLQPLLAALAAGVVIENLAVAQGDSLRAAVRRGAPPVLVVFFVAVGASLRLDAVAAIGISAVALSAVRLGFIRLGVAAGIKSSGLPESIGRHALPSGSRRSSPPSFQGGATRCSRCWWRRLRFTSSWDRSCFAAGWRGPASSMRTRCARSWSSPTASRTSMAARRMAALR
jgi:Kef-type K+ transport system membrane component KefB